MYTKITLTLIVPTEQAEATEAQLRYNLGDVEDCHPTITHELVESMPED